MPTAASTMTSSRALTTEYPTSANYGYAIHDFKAPM